MTKTNLFHQNYEMRPSIRVLGALLTTFFAYLSANSAIPLFSAEHLSRRRCAGRGKLICEFGNWLVSVIPSEAQGPLEGISHILVALICLYLTWWLLRPLVVTKQRGSEVTEI